jgi:TRAP-type uncharacterized transport system substrate-binding protein
MSEKDPKKKSLRLRLRVPGGAVAYRELSIVTLIAALIIGAAFLITYRFVRPAPPGSFVISTGNEAGAYHMYGQRYRELLAKERISVEVRPSVGSIENLQRLADPESGVEVALVQGGVATPEQAEGLVSLAALYLEPLWIFYRNDNPLTLLGQLSGKRIAVGPEGSGTRVLVTHVLEAGSALKRGMPLSPLTGRDAADALIAGRLDAALFVAAPDASLCMKYQLASAVSLPIMAQLTNAEGSPASAVVRAANPTCT